MINLLKKIYQGQYGVDRWRLSGGFLCLGAMPFIASPIYEVRTGKIYTIVSSSIASKIPNDQIIMIESLNGAPVIDEGTNPDPDIEPPVSTADFSSIDFSTSDFLTV
jgi:hypothetical protein